jgi:hypothetical protein
MKLFPRWNESVNMRPAMRSLLDRSDPATAREAGRIMLVMASFLAAEGRDEDVRRAVENAAALIEHAASVEEFWRRH